MFSMARSKPHSARKRMLSNIYSKSSIQSSRAMSAITAHVIGKRFKTALEQSTAEPVNVFYLLNAATMDMVTAYEFGLAASSNLLDNVAERDHFLELYESRQDYAYWPQEWPGLTQVLAMFGLDPNPKFVSDASREIEDWCLSMFDRACESLTKFDCATEKETDSPADYPVVYTQLKTAMARDAKKQDIDVEDQSKVRLEIASEILDHILAGFDTSGITLTFLAYELSRPQNEKIQARLREEFQRLPIDDETGLPAPKVLDSAPYLNGVLQEALRLHAAIPGPQPRRTPHVPGGSCLGPDGEYLGIPGGVRISAQAWSLHRNANVFPDPEAFSPDRWLSSKEDGSVEYDPSSEMNRWFWAFGSGGRMCVGSNLAIHRKSSKQYH
jgi:hypothetical protein